MYDQVNQNKRRSLLLALAFVILVGTVLASVLYLLNFGIGFSGVFPRDYHPVILFVPRHDGAVAVKDQAAGRRQEPDLDAVLIGQKAELVGLIDLKVAHPVAEGHDHGGLDAAQHHAATAHVAEAFQRVLGRPSHALAPMLSPAPPVRRCRPRSQTLAKTTTG